MLRTGLNRGLKSRLKTEVANPQPACVLHYFSCVLARTKVQDREGHS